MLYEDSAALAGLVAAIVGLGPSVLTADHLYDSLASAVIGVILIYVACQLAWSARGLIVGEAPPERVRDDVPSGEAERLMVRLRRRFKAEHPELMDSYVERGPR